jgi:hypothetical protein
MNQIELHKFQSHAFTVITYLTWFLYFVILLGLSANAPQYLDNLQYYIKIYISLFLILRFNPFTYTRFTELDARIAFSAGLFLLTTTAIDTILLTYLEDLRGYIDFLKF